MNAPFICPECGQARPVALDVALDRDSGTVARHGKEVHLAPHSTDLFACLLERYPRVQSKGALWEWIYDGGFNGDPEIIIIDVWVCKVRPVIETLGITIETVWGKGFRLTENVGVNQYRRQTFTDSQKAEIKRHWENLETDAYIAALMGVAAHKIGSERNLMGLTRPRSETLSLRKRAASLEAA